MAKVKSNYLMCPLCALSYQTRWIEEDKLAEHLKEVHYQTPEMIQNQLEDARKITEEQLK